MTEEMTDFRAGIMAGVAIGTNDKVERVRKWLGMSFREIDHALGYKEGRTYSYCRKYGYAEPARDFLTKLRALCVEEKGSAPPDEWYFDGLDTHPEMPGALKAVEGSMVPYFGPVGCPPPPVIQEQVRSRVSFRLPEGSGYWRIPDDSMSPRLRRGDLILSVPTPTPSHEAIATVMSGLLVQPYITKRTPEGVEWEPLSDVQPKPAEDAAQVGIIAEVVTEGASGVRIAIECETGLTLEMLRQIGR